MIDFDLEKWQTGEYDVFTANGKEVKQFTYFRGVQNKYPPLAGVVHGDIQTWRIDGAYSFTKEPHIFNLKLRPKVKIFTEQEVTNLLIETVKSAFSFIRANTLNLEIQSKKEGTDDWQSGFKDACDETIEYIDALTKRPDNPLSEMLAEQNITFYKPQPE